MTATFLEDNLVKKKQLRIKGMDPEKTLKLESVKTVRLARRAAFNTAR